MSIIRRNNSVYATLGTCYSVWINTVVSPDDGHIVARSMQRKEINILRKIVHQVGFVYKIRRTVRFPSRMPVLSWVLWLAGCRDTLRPFQWILGIKW